MAFLACFYVWSLFGPLGPELQKRLALSDLRLSVLVAIPVILGSLLRIPMGILTDRYGGRVVFAALMAYTAVILGALSIWHNTYTQFLVLSFLLGFAGASFAVGVPYVNRWYPRERQGLALGVYGMGMGGTVVSGLLAPHLVEDFGLTATFASGAFVMIAVAAVFALVARDAPGQRAGTASLAASARLFRHSGRAWALTLFYFLCFGGFVAMFLYLPKLLTGVYGLSKTDAGARAAGFALFAVLARPLGGWLSDRLGAERVLGAVFAATAVLASVLAAAYSSIGPLTLACLAMAAALGLGTGAVFKLVAKDFPAEVGAVTGVVGAAGGLGGFFPPLVMASVKGVTGSYWPGFLLLAATALVCLGVLRGVSGESQGHT